MADDKEEKDAVEEGEEEEEQERPTPRKRLVMWLSRAQFASTTALVVFLLTLTFLWSKIFITIPPGHLGVMYRYLKGGTVTDQVWPEGLHILVPWNRLTPYEVRLQQKEITFTVLSEEGLNLSVTVSVRFHLRPDMLGYLHQDIGPDYYERLIKPEVHAHVRRTFGSRPAHEIYGSARDVLQELGQVPVIARLGMKGSDGSPQPYIEVEELKLMDINLPDIVESAIADKYKQEQLMLEYKFKLEREEKEAERKRTEAAGIRDYNLIAAKVSPDLLRWRGIDAMSDLAKSPSSKVIVLGGGSGGVPIILNLPDNPAAASSSAAEAGSAAPAAPVASLAPPATTAVPATTTTSSSASSAGALASAAPSAKPAAIPSAVPTAVASAAPTSLPSAAPAGSVASAATSKAAP